MNNYTREDILRMVEEEDVGFIRLQFTDIFGTMKNIAITTSQLEKALDNEIMFDGSSIEGFARHPRFAQSEGCARRHAPLC